MSKLLIHTCCADCALKMGQSISSDKTSSFSKIAWYYYNPNIHPKTEYLARMQALKKTAKEQGFLLKIADYRPVEYFEKIKHKGSHPKPEKRCPLCWQLRLEHSFAYAQEKEFTSVTTTLITSYYQNQQRIVSIGHQLSKKYQLDFYLPASINKDLKTTGFYKQNYCGCVYSLVERMRDKY